MNINLHIYPSPLTNETRIRKITGWLENNRVFDRIVVAGIASPPLPVLQRMGKRRLYVRLRRGKTDNAKWILKSLQFLPWYARVLALALRLQPACVNAHSLSVLPLAVVIKWLCGSKLAYDAHELETEVHTAVGIRKRFVKIIERLFLPCADEIVVVSDSIAEWYKKTYSIPLPYVVRNMPSVPIQTQRSRYFRECFSIPDDKVIALYMGKVAKGRKIEEIIQVWREVNPTWHLIIVGSGPLLETCRGLAGNMETIHFHDPVPMNQIVEMASSADLGLCFLEPTCLSYYFSLPNKLFEYLYAGLPVVANDLPEIRKVTKGDECCWIFPHNDIKQMFSLQPADIANKASSTRRIAERYKWSTETLVLEKLYKALGFLHNPLDQNK